MRWVVPAGKGWRGFVGEDLEALADRDPANGWDTCSVAVVVDRA
jgi:hypothetical protein